MWVPQNLAGGEKIDSSTQTPRGADKGGGEGTEEEGEVSVKSEDGTGKPAIKLSQFA